MASWLSQNENIYLGNEKIEDNQIFGNLFIQIHYMDIRTKPILFLIPYLNKLSLYPV